METKYLFSVFTKGNTARLFFTELEDINQIQEDVGKILNNIRLHSFHLEHLITPLKSDILNDESYFGTKVLPPPMINNFIVNNGVKNNEFKKFNFSEKTYLDFSLNIDDEITVLKLSKIHDKYNFNSLLKMIINNEIPLLSTVGSNRRDIQMGMKKENNLCKFLLSLLFPGPKIYFGKDIEEVKSELEKYKINYTENNTSTN